MRALAPRPHSTAELGRKLTRRGFEAEHVAAALARLVERGYLDDAAYARSLIRHRSGTRGASMIAAELAAKGVSRETGQAALAELEPAAQLEAAVKIVRGLRRSGPFHELLQAAGPKLARRGFSTGVIREACRQVLACEAATSG